MLQLWSDCKDHVQVCLCVNCSAAYNGLKRDITGLSDVSPSTEVSKMLYKASGTVIGATEYV